MIKRLLLLAFWILGMTAALAEPRVIWSEDFEKPRRSQFVKELLKQYKQVEILEDQAQDGSNALRVGYVGCKKGSERVSSWVELPKKNLQAATLRFQVRFDEDFQWVKGGKMHGFGPKKQVTGGQKGNPEGWSSRATFEPKGGLSIYYYHQDRKHQWGDSDKSRTRVLKPGKWQDVTLEVQLNDEGKKNGWSRLSVDGKEVALVRNVRFREIDSRDSAIHYFFFLTFHGGHTPDFAPTDRRGNFVTVYADYDNFEVLDGVLNPL